MALDREQWKAEFNPKQSLPWTCPSCSGGRLTVVKNSMHMGQTNDSAEAQALDISEPEWIDGRFSCMMGCHHCEGKIAVAGIYRVQDDRHYDKLRGEQGDYHECLKPLFFSEPPNIIVIPDSVPDDVASRLRDSFRLYWCDLEATANKIRASVEKLMTVQRIQQTTGRKKAGSARSFLTLHQRLKRFSEKQPDLAEKLLAAKWLGNAGSHSRPLTQDDILDGYEILEFVLAELYVKQSKRVGAIARVINRRAGPRSPRSKRRR